MTDEHVKKYPVTPGKNIQLENLPSEEKDAAMGRYIDASSQLEGMVQLAIGLIMGIELPTLGSVFAILGVKQSIDLLEAVALDHLNEHGSKRVHSICQRLARRNMRRNHIVHGRWSQAVIVDDEFATQEWVRLYDHGNPEMRKMPYNDPKIAGMY